MTFTNVFSKWKESLDFFKKESLKMFILVTLNNTMRSLGIFFNEFWWLLLLAVVSFIGMIFSMFGKNAITIFSMNNGVALGFHPISGISMLLGLLSLVVLLVSLSYLIFIPYLIVRPSIEAKNSFYFKKHFKRIFGFCFLMFLVMISSLLIAYVVGVKVLDTSFAFKFFATILGTVLTLTIFFFLDCQKKLTSVFTSILKALKAFFYFLPVLMFLTIVILFFNYLVTFLFSAIKGYFIIGTISHIIFGVISAIFYLGFAFVVSFFNLSLIVNYYTMLKHKYYNLFYN